MIQHKHKGVVRTDNGRLRLHSITQQHTDFFIKKYHNESLTANQKMFLQGKLATKKSKSTTKKKVSNKLQKKYVEAPIDSDGYINIDLDKSPIKGIRVKFTRIEGSKKRIVGLSIDKK